MTITEALTYVKDIHNESAAQNPNWSDSELYGLFQAKAQHIAGKIGLIEGKDTSTSTVIGTADYSFPTNFIRIRRLQYDGRGLKYSGFRDYEARMPTGVMSNGTPREFLIWNNQVTLIPTPDSVKTLTFYGEKMQSTINSASSTIDLPVVFHAALCDFVLVDMFMKDENEGSATFYRNICTTEHLPSMREYAQRRRRRGYPSRVIDADSVLETEFGVI